MPFGDALGIYLADLSETSPGVLQDLILRRFLTNFLKESFNKFPWVSPTTSPGNYTGVSPKMFLEISFGFSLLLRFFFSEMLPRLGKFLPKGSKMVSWQGASNIVLALTCFYLMLPRFN